MCAFASRARLLCSGILTGLACVALTAGAAAQQKSAPPDFSSSQAGWLTFRVEFMAGPSGPSPVRDDPAHPRVSNARAAPPGSQPTFLIGDLTNPNFDPWA